MKVVIVGGTGLIGTAVARELGKRHQIITVGHTHGDFNTDVLDKESITDLYQKIGKFDALISTLGKVIFADFKALDEEQYFVGINDKLMGQVNLVKIGLQHITDRGSFTLTSGILSQDPIRSGVSASMVNGAINGFVIGAAIEMPRGIRINAVSPTVIAEAMENYAPYFRGFKPVSASDAALAYSKSVEGLQTGQVYKVGY
jgi:NAD(P)-dependent dehydrogenase (short-subunit alcohol dehydrogenase family)